MEKLWAPWRIHYVQHITKQRGCIFCKRIKSKRDREHFITARTPYSIAILNIYPYNNGHVMVMPKRHVKHLRSLKDAEKCDLLDLVETIREKLQSTLRPDGFNMGINIGRSAGAGVRGHIHIHIVPRWVGDTNFMPVLGSTKVVSESLRSTYKKLTQCSIARRSKKKKK